jgi:hypothetical protein
MESLLWLCVPFFIVGFIIPLTPKPMVAFLWFLGIVGVGVVALCIGALMKSPEVLVYFVLFGLVLGTPVGAAFLAGLGACALVKRLFVPKKAAKTTGTSQMSDPAK